MKIFGITKIRLGDYGMVLALLALCVLFSLLTLKRQSGDGFQAVAELINVIENKLPKEQVN